MIQKILKIIFGDANERVIKRYQPIVEKVNQFEPQTKELSDQELRDKTSEFRHRLQEGQTLEDILPETFAIVREASVRTLGFRHFDVQILGGIVLHEGKIAEMKTGEGKTLAATLPVYLNALNQKGVHVITVNDYLAKRDAEWMGPIYEFLGLRIGFLQHEMDYQERREVYNCEITYGTNNEFGFDYLRSNMVDDARLKVQREHSFAIVDEVDSILIDEARTPLIISGSAQDSTDLFYKIDKLIPRLKPAGKDSEEKWLQESGDYQYEEKDRNVVLTESGVNKAEKLLGIENLYDSGNIALVHHINQALKAHIVFHKDIDYIVENGEVIIIDEHTGRKMQGRRYSDGLHQALEAKERVSIKQETQTLASITFQNYFRMYDKLAGMTGTAETEAEEFYKIYKLSVVSIPTHMEMVRADYTDRIYRTDKEKLEAIVDEIEECHKRGQPVLVGTISIEKNEQLSKIMNRKGIRHNILNAKFHEMEAMVITQAGNRGTVTISTNMAGRGTDIQLGEGVLELGGLHIIGTERHEARRIDNQLRGRSGRQGDPGSSRFYLSLEDDLMRLFGSARLSNLMQKMGFEEGEQIEHPWITKTIANAQKKVETRNFEIRKNLLEYDDVMNLQRQYIYQFRDKVLYKENLKETLLKMTQNLMLTIVEESSFGAKNLGINEVESILEQIHLRFSISFDTEIDKRSLSKAEELSEYLLQSFQKAYENREKELGSELLRELERYILLYSIDSKWKDHLANMDSIKEGIHLRAYAEKNPLTEYKLETSNLFENLKLSIVEESLEFLFKVQVRENSVPRSIENEESMQFGEEMHEEVNTFSSTTLSSSPQNTLSSKKRNLAVKTVKIKRNDPCPCGSGKKYKLCCGK